MTLLCPQYVAASDYESMDEVARYAEAQQGHRYALGDSSVIALETGRMVDVAPIRGDVLGEVLRVSAQWLTPEPMRYHADQIP